MSARSSVEGGSTSSKGQGGPGRILPLSGKQRVAQLNPIQGGEAKKGRISRVFRGIGVSTLPRFFVGIAGIPTILTAIRLRHGNSCPSTLRSMCPFLKELVKRKRLPSGWLRSGSAGRRPLFPGVRWARGFLLSSRRLVVGSESVVVASPREVTIVLFEAIAPNSFLREVPPTTAVSSSAGASASADADLSSANSSPSGPLQPEHRAADTDPCEPGPPHPGHISSWPKREGSQAALRQLRSNNRSAAWSL